MYSETSVVAWLVGLPCWYSMWALLHITAAALPIQIPANDLIKQQEMDQVFGSMLAM